MEIRMPSIIDLNAELANLTSFRRTPQATVADGAAVLRNSWFPGRNGDVLFAAAPLTAIAGPDPVSVWIAHGSSWADDAVVPLLAQAPGFRLKGGEALTVTQIAPAAALLLGIAPPAGALDSPALVRVDRRQQPQ